MENNLLDDFFNNLEFESKEENILLNNDNYLNWLKGFIKKYGGFYDIQSDYFLNNRSKNDAENIKKIKYLFRIIAKYASNNYVYSNNEYCDINYYVKYKEITFQIGMMYGEERIYYCNKAIDKKQRKIIDLELVKNNINTENKTKYDSLLNDLAKTINGIIDEGVPVNAIEDTVNNSITNHKKRKK